MLPSWLLFFSSCMKEDEPIVLPPHNSDAQLFAVNIGEDYSREVYFDLETKDTLGNNFTDWDLAFEASPIGDHIWINGGKAVFAAQTNQTVLSNVFDTVGSDWKFDGASWHVDSTAIGNWQQPSGNPVYIIDRGYFYSGNDRFWKIIFQSVNASQFSVEYGRLNDAVTYTKTINKSTEHNYIYFTFDNNGSVLNFEPEKTKWDILFTRYRYIYYDFTPPLPYYVNGVLLNPYLTLAAVDSTTGYDSITYDKARNMSLSANRDVIGYNWKTYVFSTSHYEVNPQFVYIIKDQAGYYYKLHFLDFYDITGHKGVPKFEYQRL